MLLVMIVEGGVTALDGLGFSISSPVDLDLLIGMVASANLTNLL